MPGKVSVTTSPASTVISIALRKITFRGALSPSVFTLATFNFASLPSRSLVEAEILDR